MPVLSTLAPLPGIPDDIFKHILFFCLYSGNEQSAYMQPDDISGHLVNFRARQASFLKTFASVSRDVNEECVKLFWRSLFLRSAREVLSILSVLQSEPSAEYYGPLCMRMELRIKGSYDPGAVANIISKMPNLKVFILRNEYDHSEPVLRRRPLAIVEAISDHAKLVERIQFESETEEPNVANVKQLLRSLPRLTTLHIDKLCIKPFPDDLRPLQESAPSLRVLSIGSAFRQHPWSDPHHRTGDLLGALSSPTCLPSLTTVFIYQKSSVLREFLRVFGPQLEELGFSGVDQWAAHGEGGHLIRLCPSLKHATYIAPEGPSWELVFPLPPHPTLQTVTVIYINPLPTILSFSGRVAMEALHALVQYGGAVRQVTLLAPIETPGFNELPSFRLVMDAAMSAGVHLRSLPLRT